jgi:eukaryotic-like serine/threonine-protein kinase
MSTTAESTHPNPETLDAFRCGRLPAPLRVAVAEHLARCRKCSGDLGATTLTGHDGSGAPEPEPDIPAPLVDHPRYRILNRIGEGGMGVVYRAEHRVMGRMVALKVLNTGVTSNPQAVDRFRREVRIASRLTHPNIVTAYDADEAGGLHFLVMEFVEGTSLDSLVRARGPLPVSTACECARQAAIGLQHAHEKGMVHRDIKPHNLMLTDQGHVKILDFGLACVAAADKFDPTSITAHAITQPHTLLGTPDFLSPEQARSAVALDVRSDLYSLGCTLYYLLTGKPPYGGTGAYAKMIAHVKEPVPDLRAVRPDTPIELAAVVQKLMAKTPEERYQTPAEVAEILLPFATAITAAGATAIAPVPSLANHAARAGLMDTRASFAKDEVTAALPLAAECEPLAEEIAPGAAPEAPGRAAVEPTKKSRGTLVAAAILLLGLAAGGVAGQWDRIKGAINNPQTARGEAKAEPAPAAPVPASTPKVDRIPVTFVDSLPDPVPLPVPPPKPPLPVTGPKPAPPTEPVKTTTPPSPVVPARKKQVLLIVPPEFRSGEYGIVTDTLNQHKAGIQLVGPEKKALDGYSLIQATKTYARTIEVDLGIKDVTNTILDAADAVIVLPGNWEVYGTGPKGTAGTEFARVVGRMVQKKKVVAAISSGILDLGVHGFLANAQVSTYTGYPSVVERLQVKKWASDPKVVVDLPIITIGELGHPRTLTEEVLKAIPEHPAK